MISGDVNPEEAKGLRQWLVSNSEVIDDPSCEALAMLLIEMLRDAQLDATERAELKRVLRELIVTLLLRSLAGDGAIKIYPLRPRSP